MGAISGGPITMRRLQMGAHDQAAMKYQLYQTKNDLLHPLREAARFGAAWVRARDLGCLTPPLFRAMSAPPVSSSPRPT